MTTMIDEEFNDDEFWDLVYPLIVDEFIDVALGQSN